MSCFQILPLFLLVISTLGSARYYDLATAEQYFTEFTNNGFSEVKVEFVDKVIPVPVRVDYRERGVVTPVKTKKAEADSSYYAAVEMIEGLYAKATGKLVPLSVDQIIDCDHVSKYLPNQVVIAMLNNGSESEADYANGTQPGVCHYDQNKVIVVPWCAIRYFTHDIHTMKIVVARDGPVAIVFSMSPSMLNYKGDGVLTPTDCDAPEPNIFSALLVGYDTGKYASATWRNASDIKASVLEAATGKEYWIIKTSLGPQYGDKGYLYLDVKSPCMMMDQGSSFAYVAIID